MKRFVCGLLALLLFCSLLTGCATQPKAPPQQTGLLPDTSVIPIYENLNDEEKELWQRILTAIENHSTEPVFIGTYLSESTLDAAADRFQILFRELTFSNPDLFWVDAYHYTSRILSSQESHTLNVEFSYVAEKDDVAELKATYQQAVEQIVSQAQAIPDLFQKVLFVYDTIMAGTVYDHDLAANSTGDLNRSAYGALISGKTVCTGYALAFRSVMDKLGIENGVEFNTYNSFSITTGHVWNYCKLGDQYYYFDLTWDDTGFDGDDYRPYLPYSHLYFGISRDELEKSSYQLTLNPPTPHCCGTEYNYYIHNGWNLESYSFQGAKDIISAQAGQKFYSIRFDSYFELEQAVEELIQNSRIFEILPNVRNLSYTVSKTDLHLMLFPK